MFAAKLPLTAIRYLSSKYQHWPGTPGTNIHIPHSRIPLFLLCLSNMVLNRFQQQLDRLVLVLVKLLNPPDIDLLLHLWYFRGQWISNRHRTSSQESPVGVRPTRCIVAVSFCERGYLFFGLDGGRETEGINNGARVLGITASGGGRDVGELDDGGG